MKLFGLILLLASAGQLSAQRSDFVEYLLQLQYVTEPLQERMIGSFNAARANLSAALTDLNDESVHEITNGLTSVIAIRDQTEELVGEVSNSENEECVGEATSTWAATLEAVGTDISACADEHIDPIYEQTEGLHIFIQDQNRLVFNAQNMVLNVFTDLNPLTSADDITPTVEALIDELFNEFEETVQPEIDRRLLEISNLRQSVPTDIQSCVAAGIVSFNSSALAIQTALNAC